MRRRRSLIAAIGSFAVLVTTFGLSVTAAPTASAEDNGLAATPLMGWSSWSYVRSDPTAAKIEAEADALKNSGLSSYGYDYVNVDDFWYPCSSSTGPAVDANGRWAVDTTKFPNVGSENGIQAVADHVHADGLKFGLYVTPGIPAAAVAANTPIAGTSDTADGIAEPSVSENNYNCGHMEGIDYSQPGAQQYINSWADEFASWGVDYVKLDGVGSFDIPDVQAWSTALRQTGRPMALELSNSLAISDATTWESLANGWRTTGDIECYCGSNGSSYPLTDYSNVSQRFDAAANWQPYGQPGGWNDMDSLEVGNGNNDGLTVPERQTQMSLWAMADAPLLLGTDLTNLDSGDLAMLENKAVIGVDQDAIPAARVIDSGNEQVFSKREPSGAFTVAVFNTDTSASHSESVSLAQLGINSSATGTDLWSGQSVGTVNGTYTATVQPGGVSLVQLTPTSASGGTRELVSAQSGRCLDTYNGDFLPGTKEEIWDCHQGLGQEFTLTSSGELRTEGATECLDVYNNETSPGTKVELWPCNGGQNQKWTVNSDGTITSQQSGMCLDVYNNETTNGTQIDVYTCNGGQNQQWSWSG